MSPTGWWRSVGIDRLSHTVIAVMDMADLAIRFGELPVGDSQVGPNRVDEHPIPNHR